MRFVRRMAMLTALATVVSIGLAGTASAATTGTTSHGGDSFTTRRSVVVTLVNSYPGQMWLYSYQLDHGRWSLLPPDEIDPGGRGVWASVSNGLFTGTEGWAAFTVYGFDDGDFLVHWDNPFIGGNTFECFPPAPLECNVSSSGGNDASVTFELF
jgi:hypothetical protein